MLIENRIRRIKYTNRLNIKQRENDKETEKSEEGLSKEKGKKQFCQSEIYKQLK